MYNPLEDERVQLGVIAVASISIVAFLMLIASDRPAEISSPGRSLVTETSPGAQTKSGDAAPVVEASRPIETPIASVGAAEESIAPLRAALRIETPAGDDATVKTPLKVPEAQQKKHHPGRRVTIRLRKSTPWHVNSATNRPSWTGPLPNKKDDAP